MQPVNNIRKQTAFNSKHTIGDEGSAIFLCVLDFFTANIKTYISVGR